MATYTFNGLLLGRDGSDNITSYSQTMLTISVPDYETGVNYTVVDNGTGSLPEVDFNLDYNSVILDGSPIAINSNDVITYLGEIDWNDGTSHVAYVLTVEVVGTNDLYFLQIGGDTIPAPSSLQDVTDFYSSVTYMGASGSGSGYEEGDFIAFSSVPNSSSSDIDNITGTDGDDSIQTGDGGDTVHGGAGDDDINGGAGNDFLYGEGDNDYITGGGGDDTIDGGAGSGDTVAYVGAGSGVTVNLATGTASDGGGGTDTLSNIENVRGSAYGDTITGDANDNEIFGLGGDDTLAGGDGWDAVRYDRDAQEGGTAGVTVNLLTGSATDGFGDTDTLSGFEGVVGTDSADSLTGDDDNNYLEGRAGADTIHGNGGNDDIRGGDDGDFLYGDDGNDRIRGSAGDDTMNGGAGDEDELDYSQVGGHVVVNFQIGETSDDGEFGVDTISGFEWVRGTAYNDSITGDANDNVFFGLSGNDILNGATGSDTARYDRDASYGGAGGVTVDLATGTATDGFGDTDTLVSIENTVGTDSDDTIDGSPDDNHIEGRVGDDTLNGYEGHDELIGGDGADIIDGGDDNDYINAGRGNDTITGGDGGDNYDTLGFDQYDDNSAPTQNVVIDVGAGTAIDAWGDSDTFSGIEEFIGTGFADSFTGNDSGSRFIGLAGGDSFTGGASDQVNYHRRRLERRQSRRHRQPV